MKICLVGLQNLLGSHGAWQAASDRCRRFMAREFGDDSVMPAYLETFEHVMRAGMPGARAMPSSTVLNG